MGCLHFVLFCAGFSSSSLLFWRLCRSYRTETEGHKPQTNERRKELQTFCSYTWHIDYEWCLMWLLAHAKLLEYTVNISAHVCHMHSDQEHTIDDRFHDILSLLLFSRTAKYEIVVMHVPQLRRKSNSCRWRDKISFYLKLVFLFCNNAHAAIQVSFAHFVFCLRHWRRWKSVRL